MTDAVDLTPARCAELVAPAISRLFVTGITAAGDNGRELVASYGGGEAIGYLIDLRNPLAAGRPIRLDQLREVYRYAEPDRIRVNVGRSVDQGLLAIGPDGTLTATDRGQEFLRDLFAQQGRVLTQRWGPTGNQTGLVGNAGLVDRLNEVLAGLLAAAAATAGGAWAVQAPPYEPAGTPPGVLLLNRLSTLRYHRADAHAAAWRAVGLTAAEMVAMPWGSEWTAARRAVEEDTNVRAAAPYATLTAEQRLGLLADLAALP